MGQVALSLGGSGFAYLQTLLMATSEAVALFSADRRFLLVNRRFEELSQLTAEHLLGRQPRELSAQFQRLVGEPGTLEALEEALALGATRHQWMALQRRPVARVLRLTTFPVLGPNATLSGSVLAVQPVTPEGEVERLKTRFLALVTEELRSPLSTVVGFSDLLLQGPSSNLTAEQREYLTLVREGAQREAAVIEQLVELVHLETGKVVLHRGAVSLAALLTRCVTSLRQGYAARAQQLFLETGKDLPLILADPERTVQLLRAVLQHVLQRTADGGVIRLTLERDGRSLRLVVRGGGETFSPEEQQWLQESFSRPGGATSPTQGPGLDLRLAEGLLHLHGGEMQLRNETDGSLILQLTFPLAS